MLDIFHILSLYDYSGLVTNLERLVSKIAFNVQYNVMLYNLLAIDLILAIN